MSNQLDTVTQLHLKSFGLSNYLVREVVQELKVLQRTGGLKEYSASDVQASIEKKISHPKTKPKSQEQLQRVLACLKGESNVIEVDFLRRLSPEKRIEVLNSRLEELAEQERKLTQETNNLLIKAGKMVTKK